MLTDKQTWPLQTILEVEWQDSVSNTQWAPVAEHRKMVTGPYRSIGYLVRCDRAVVQLAQSMGGGTQNIVDSISIPRCAVRRMRRIGKVKKSI